MILDEKLEFCDNTSVAAGAGTAVVGDVIDLRNAGRDLLDTLYLVIQFTEALASGGAATLDLQLTSSSTADLATSPVQHFNTGARSLAESALGRTYIVPLPKARDYGRYLGLRAVTATATTTAGSINAFLTADPQNWRAYADAQN